MGRTPTGKRHETSFQWVTGQGMVKIQAVCICDTLTTPPRFGRERAELDAQDHMETWSKQGKGGTPGQKKTKREEN